jgi:hypothetical protein
MVLTANFRGTSMTKLRTLLAAALLTLPVLALSASEVTADNVASGTRLEGTSLTGCCMIYLNGKWMCIPC